MMGQLDGYRDDEPDPSEEDIDVFCGPYGMTRCLWCGIEMTKMHPDDNCCDSCFNEKSEE